MKFQNKRLIQNTVIVTLYQESFVHSWRKILFKVGSTMTLKTIVYFFLLSILFYGCTCSDHNTLLKTSKKLGNMTTVQYQAEVKNFNFNTGELGITNSSIAFFDFNNDDSIVGAKYLFSNNSSDMGFNGSTTFYANKEKKILVYRSVKSYKDLIGIPFLTFSIQQLRSLLPWILKDRKSVV